MSSIKKTVAKDSCNWAISGGAPSNETNIKINKEIANARVFIKNPVIIFITSDIFYMIIYRKSTVILLLLVTYSFKLYSEWVYR